MTDKGMDFKYGDLVVTCGQCGNTETLDTYVTDGIDIMLFNKHDSYFRMKCTSCGSSLDIRLVPSKDADDDILTTTDEEIINTEVNEELSQENPIEEIIQ